MKKIYVFLLLLSVFLCSSLFANGAGDTVVDPASLKGKLIYMEGKVTVNDTETEVGDIVIPGDSIKTELDGRADIAFGSRNIISLGSDTVSAIDPAWSGVQVSQGVFRTVLNGLSKLGFGEENPFKVQTSTAVMAVRGTTFFAYVPKEGETYFCDCNGVIDLSSPDKNVSQTVEAGHHKALWLVKTESGEVQSFPSGMYYHNDEELNILAAKVKTRIPWK